MQKLVQEMSELTLTIKCSNADKATVVIESTATVLDLKGKIAEQLSVPAAQQRLIYKGRVLKDESTLENYDIQNEHTVHMVKGAAPGGASPAPTAAAPAPTSAYSAPRPAYGAPPAPGANPMQGMGALFGNPGAMPMGPGGMPDMSRMQEQLMRNPEMMRQVMNSPMMENLMNHPELMRSMMMSNPQMQAMMDANPQMRHILNDPSVSFIIRCVPLFRGCLDAFSSRYTFTCFVLASSVDFSLFFFFHVVIILSPLLSVSAQVLRQSMEMMRNPNALREAQRSQDLQMAQLENLPGGFNALQRMFEQVQEPMMEAAQNMGTNGANNGTAASSSAGSAAPSNPTNTALPNPWGGGGGSAGSSGAPGAPGAPAGAVNPFAAMGAGGFNPYAGMGGLGGMGGEFSFANLFFGSSVLFLYIQGIYISNRFYILILLFLYITGGGMGGMGGMGGDPSQMAAMLQDPFVQQMMQQMLSDPQALEQVCCTHFCLP